MRRKFPVFLFVFLLVIAMTAVGAPVAFAADTWDGSSVDTAWYDDHMGDTTYTISTGAQLAGLAVLVRTGDTATSNTPVNFIGKTINLGDDIDLGSHPWTPIGYYNSFMDSRGFDGTFDGGSHTVSGLAIGTQASPASTSTGLFGYAPGESSISNLDVEISGIYNSGDLYTGGLVGYTEGDVSGCSVSGSINGEDGAMVGLLAGGNDGTITGCETDGSIVSDSYAGGLVGSGDGTITNSYSNASVTGNYAGGLAGICYSEISDCYATGDVEAVGYDQIAGGLVGYFYAYEDISDSYATGDVSATGDESMAGGFVGYGYEDSEITISGCYATGGVTAGDDSYAGGFVGYMEEYIALDGCFATGDVAAGTGSEAGGLLGYTNGDVDYCFAFGSVTAGADSNIGGFAGHNANYIYNSYAAGPVAGGNNDGSNVGGFVGFNWYTIETSYARGPVSGTGTNTYAGGFIGTNDQANVTDCYFDTQGTGQAEGIANDNSSQTVTGLPTSQMTGSAAPGNMTGLTFPGTFTAKDNTDTNWYYPQITGIANSSDDTVKAASLESVTIAVSTSGGTSKTTVTPGSLTLYVGGRATLTPTVPGGTWQWDPAYIELHHSVVTVKALKPGHTTIHYTIGYASADIPVTILAGGMPKTGQDFAPLYWLAALAGGALAAGVLFLRRRKKERE